MKKTLIFAAIATAGMIAAPSAQAAMATDAVLTLGPQDGFCDFGLGTYPDACVVAAIPSANYFAMDNDGSGEWENSERVGIEAGTGGINLAAASPAGQIDSVWNFFGGDGWHTTKNALSITSDNGAGNVTLGMAGWNVFWNGGDIDMGQGADAIVTCGVDCADGDSFTLDYNAVVPSGAFIGVAYVLHLSGTVGGPSAIPVPAAVWLFGSGLLGLVGVARRRKVA